MPENVNSILLNSKLRDSSSKIIFDEPILCAQFLRDYVADIPCLREIRPEDIEDASEQYVHLFSEERNSDRVKKVNIKNGTPFFLISLIEHKTKVEYNVTMQIFRYMVYIWEAYERDYLVPLRKYSTQELLAREDEISLIMLINRLQEMSDISSFRSLPEEQLEAILKDSPDHIVNIIADMLLAFLLKSNVSVNEAEKVVVKEKNMGQLFADMEPIDIQAEQAKIRAQRQELEIERQEIETERQEIKAERQEFEAEWQKIKAQKLELEIMKQKLETERKQLLL